MRAASTSARVAPSSSRPDVVVASASASTSCVPERRCSERTFASSATRDVSTVRKLYKGPQMKTFRALVRFKLAQLAAIGGLATPWLAVGAGEDVSAVAMAAAVGAGLGSAACSGAIQYYASRYVGELALLDDGRALRVSTMDFWGNRVDETYDVASRISPPLKGLSRDALEEMASRMFIPLDVYGARQYVLSLRHGDLVDADALFDVLSDGEYAKKIQAARSSADAS